MKKAQHRSSIVTIMVNHCVSPRYHPLKATFLQQNGEQPHTTAKQQGHESCAFRRPTSLQPNSCERAIKQITAITICLDKKRNAGWFVSSSVSPFFSAKRYGYTRYLHRIEKILRSIKNVISHRFYDEAAQLTINLRGAARVHLGCIHSTKIIRACVTQSAAHDTLFTTLQYTLSTTTAGPIK